MSHLTWLLLAVAGTSVASALTAYNCQHPGVTQKILDTTNPGACPDPETDFGPPIQESFQLLKIDGERSLTATNCRVLSTKKVTKCGFDSISYGSRFIRWDQPLQVKDYDCKDALTRGRITVEGKVFDIHPGTTINEHYFSQGWVKVDGGCEVASFTTDGVKYQGYYEETFVKILVKRVHATIDDANDMLHFDNGLRAPLRPERVFDQDLGLLVWSSQEAEKCTDDLSEFFRGIGTIRPRLGMAHRVGTIIIVGESEHDARHLALILGQRTRVCSTTCHKVSTLPGFAVCFYQHGSPAFNDADFDARAAARDKDLSLTTLKARSDYLHVNGHLRMHEKLKKIVQQYCAVEKKTLYNKLQAISGAANPHALLDVLGPGHMITPAGHSAAYITKCVPVHVIRANYPNCTYEVPVVLKENNHSAITMDTSTSQRATMFMNSVTRILQRFPTTVTCSKIMPVRWNLEGDWWCSHPEIVRCKAPEQLKPESSGYHIDAGFTTGLASNGLLDDHMRSEVYMFQEEQAHRDAFVMKGSRYGLKNARGNELGPNLNMDDVDQFSADILENITPAWLFNLFGRYTTYILGVLTFFSIFWTVVTAAARCINEFATNGWDGGRTVAKALAACCGIFFIPKKLLFAVLDSYKSAAAGSDSDGESGNVTVTTQPARAPQPLVIDPPPRSLNNYFRSVLGGRSRARRARPQEPGVDLPLMPGSPDLTHLATAPPQGLQPLDTSVLPMPPTTEVTDRPSRNGPPRGGPSEPL